MTRRWNAPIWCGFVIVIVALVSYTPIFAVFPATRDIPWVNYLLFLLGGALLAVGVTRAFRNPQRYRGKISGSILAALSVLLFGVFLSIILYFGRQLPSSAEVLQQGQPAPAFVLPDIAGKNVASSDLLKNHRAIVLIFYRGYW